MTVQPTTVEVIGQNRFKYFRKPIIPFIFPNGHKLKLTSRSEREPLDDVIRNAHEQCYISVPQVEPCRNISTQTDYRENETQTSPWEPPYKIIPGHNPEVLTITNFTWRHGLPAGMHEIELINRMRMKKIWETILPPMDTLNNIKKRESIVKALEMAEWAFRDSEIQFIMDLRLKLMKEVSQLRECERDKYVQNRFKRLRDNLKNRKDKEIKAIRHNLSRELRKLHLVRHKMLQSRKDNIIKSYDDHNSEMHLNQMQFSSVQQRRHRTLEKKLLKENHGEIAVPDWLPTHEELKAIVPKRKPDDLCIRETRWTEDKLKKLHADLKAIRLNSNHVEFPILMKKKYKHSAPIPPPCRIATDKTTTTDQSYLLMQKIIRGRATQCMMYEGRDRCRELIEELQSTHALEEYSEKLRQAEKRKMIEQQQQQYKKSLQEERLGEILNTLEGATVSGILDFLSKELIRLRSERKLHAFALLAERERSMREAAEAGRRQLERNRRRELDEMFRQLNKVDQNSIEVYLEDIIKDEVKRMSDQNAEEYILEYSRQMNDTLKYKTDDVKQLADEELVADMIYNFVLPEVEKHNFRKKMKENQQSYLQSAHKAIYNQTMNLPLSEKTTVYNY